MFWADRLAGDIKERFGTSRPLVVRDEKTVSGRVHIGSMRGVAIHGTVSQALNDAGVENQFIWEHNDFDPMDDIPVYLDRAVYEEHLGKPLCMIPSPEPGFKSYGEYFAKEFQKVIEDGGWHPKFVWCSELYQSGRMDGVIREALEHADTVRRIMKEVSGAERKEGWLPISVICPQCHKMTTTDATDFDGETVAVRCLPKKVEYTEGCGFEGRLSPFGGSAKLYWKCDWPAKWKVYGVDVEGGGKDHSTKGGSRDVGNHIAKEVFDYEPPFDMPYEFFLVGGKKMSSSKGRGNSAQEIAELVPQKILRLTLLGKDINQAIDFDAEGDTIAILFDQYDKLAANYWAGNHDDYARLFEFLHPDGTPSEHFLPRFSQVAFIAQMPHMNLHEEIEKLKGSPLTDEDRAEADLRREYALKWLPYAPERYVFKLQDELPEAARDLSKGQKGALARIADVLEQEGGIAGEALHEKLHDIKEESGLSPAELFSAIYLAFLGKDHGPKAGWFLSVLPRDLTLARLREAAS